MKRGTIATILVGPNALMREGLARILGSAGYRILASTSDIEDAMRSPLPAGHSILLIIDDENFDTALKQIKSSKQRCPAGRVAVLGQHGLGEMVSAFRAGANAYFLKATAPERFIKSLELVALGVTLFPPEILSFIAQQKDHGCRAGDTCTAAGHYKDGAGDRHPDASCADGEVEAHELGQQKDSFTPRLSARQLSILHRLIQGASNKAMAREMAITEATIKVHVKAILRKIRVHNRTQAAVWAMSHRPLMSGVNQALPDQAVGAAGITPTESAIVTGGWQAESVLNTAPEIDQPLLLAELPDRRSTAQNLRQDCQVERS